MCTEFKNASNSPPSEMLLICHKLVVPDLCLLKTIHASVSGWVVLRGSKLNIMLLFTAWLSISMASVLVVLSGTSPEVCAFWRLLISFTVILCYSVVFDIGALSFKALSLRQAVKSMFSGVSLALHFLLWMRSLFLIPVALSTTLVVTYPLINVPIERYVTQRKPSIRELLGLALAFAGVVVAVRPYSSTTGGLEGVFLAVGGAVLAAIYFSLGRDLRMSGVKLTTYTILSYGFASLTLLTYGLLNSVSLVPERTSSWVYLILLALIPMLGGHTVMNYLLKHLKSYVVTSIALGEPLGASLLAALFLGQVPSNEVFIGMALTLCGISITIFYGGGSGS